MFEVKTVNYNLKRVPENAEAYLSNLFFILYFLYIAKKGGKKIEKAELQKGIADIYERLLEEGRIDTIKVFNLPLYRYHYGHYNQAIETEYTNRLVKGNLVDYSPKNKYAYVLTQKALELMERYDNTVQTEDKNFIKNTIQDYTRKNFIADFGRLIHHSHEKKVIYNNEIKAIDDLPEDELKAVAYNASPQSVNFDDFRKGIKATIFPTDYLLKLNSLLEEAEMAANPIEPAEQQKILSELLYSTTNNQQGDNTA